MATIPLPALHVAPIAQPQSPLETYAQLLGVQNQQQQLQQRQAIAPLQLQDAQQTAQSGAIDLQQKQQQLKDQKAMSATMQQWGQSPSATPGASTAAPSKSSIPSYDDLVPLAIKNGASFQAVQALQSHVLDMKAKASTIAMDDARAGASNADALKAKNGMIVDAMTGVMSQPDALLPQAIQTTAQELAQKGLFDPPHVQQAMQLAQLAQQNPAQARQQLDIQAKSLGGFSKLLEDAQKSIAVKNEQGKTDPNSPLYAPSEQAVAMGTAPGATQIQQGKVQQAAKVAGAEEAARMPGEMALARQRQALSQGDPVAAARLLVNGDATLSELKARGSTPEFISKTLQAAHQLSNGQYNAQSADADFQVAKSPANVAFFGSAKSLTDKGGTLDQLAQTAKSIPSNQIPAFNSIADWEKAATGSGPIAKFAAQALGVADDYSKVMGGGQGSDTSRLQALKQSKAFAGRSIRRKSRVSARTRCSAGCMATQPPITQLLPIPSRNSGGRPIEYACHDPDARARWYLWRHSSRQRCRCPPSRVQGCSHDAISRWETGLRSGGTNPGSRVGWI